MLTWKVNRRGDTTNKISKFEEIRNQSKNCQIRTSDLYFQLVRGTYKFKPGTKRLSNPYEFSSNDPQILSRALKPLKLNPNSKRLFDIFQRPKEIYNQTTSNYILLLIYPHVTPFSAQKDKQARSKSQMPTLRKQKGENCFS